VPIPSIEDERPGIESRISPENENELRGNYSRKRNKPY
jgi:hypothetical protein